MIIRSLYLRNWMPFKGEHEVAVPKGATVILARYEGQPGRSNYAGKTALLESILYALFAWRRKRLADDVVSHGEKKCVTHVEFDGWWVQRCRGPTELLVGETNEKPGASGKDAEKYIVDRLRMTEQDFMSTIAFRQGEMTAFLKATPAQRQDILASWLQQEHWQRCEKRARSLAATAERERQRVEGVVEMLERQGAAFDREDAEKRIELLTKTLAESAKKIARADEDKRAYEDRNRLFKALERFNHLAEQAHEIRGYLSSDPVPEPTLDMSALLVDRAEAQRVLKEAESRVTGDFDGACPVTKGECPVAEEVREQLGGANALTYLGQLRDAQDHFREVDIKVEQARIVWDRYRTSSKKRAEYEAKLGPIEEEGARLRPDAQRAIDYLAKHPDEDPRRVWAEDGKWDSPRPVTRFQDPDELRKETVRLEREVGVLRERLDEAGRRDESLAESRQNAATAAGRASSLAMAADLFGRNGIQSAEADLALRRIEEQANEVLGGTGLEVGFASERETKRGDRKPTLDVRVTESGSGEYDASEVSEGARTLCGAAIRFAAAGLLREWRGSPVSFLLVDEPFTSLDYDNRRLLARHLTQMAARAGFEQVLVVTHDPDLADLMPHKIEIERGADGFSVVKGEG